MDTKNTKVWISFSLISMIGLLGVLSGDVKPLDAQRLQSGMYGFSARSAIAERGLEAKFLALPSPENARAAHAYLTAEPHVAGTPRDRVLADWVRDRWREYGLDEVQITEHEVLLPFHLV